MAELRLTDLPSFLKANESCFNQKKRLDYIYELREGFNKMTKQELVEKAIIAYDELVKVLWRKENEIQDGFERELDLEIGVKNIRKKALEIARIVREINIEWDVEYRT